MLFRSLLSALPSATIPAMFANQAGVYQREATTSILLSTLLSIVTFSAAIYLIDGGLAAGCRVFLRPLKPVHNLKCLSGLMFMSACDGSQPPTDLLSLIHPSCYTQGATPCKEV